MTGTLCEEDLSLLRSWSINMTASQEYELTESGARELAGLGDRFRKRFPDIFDQPYDPSKIQVGATKKADFSDLQ